MATKSLYSALFVLFAISTLIFVGCKKEEGEGGRSSIKGTVIEQEMDTFLNPEVVNEYPLTAERVYIIYGDESEVYDDDMRTDFEGRYHFRFLREGTYTVFTYTECNVFDDGCQEAGGEYPIIRTVEL